MLTLASLTMTCASRQGLAVVPTIATALLAFFVFLFFFLFLFFEGYRDTNNLGCLSRSAPSKLVA